jgi:hypothetical protein
MNIFKEMIKWQEGDPSRLNTNQQQKLIEPNIDKNTVSRAIPCHTLGIKFSHGNNLPVQVTEDRPAFGNEGHDEKYITGSFVIKDLVWIVGAHSSQGLPIKTGL